jgi:uncharacterized membrane protein YphA (DoxX/SURF4 family)
VQGPARPPAGLSRDGAGIDVGCPGAPVARTVLTSFRCSVTAASGTGRPALLTDPAAPGAPGPADRADRLSRSTSTPHQYTEAMLMVADQVARTGRVTSEGMDRQTVGEWIGTAARLGLAAVWGWAGLAKVGDPEAAAQAVRAYRLLPEALVQPFGYGLPFLEIAVALLLVVGLGTRIAATLSGLLLLVYISSIASVWARGISIDCGCFGGGGAVSASKTAYLQEILRDLGFLLVAAWLVWRPRSRLSLDGRLAAG